MALASTATIPFTKVVLEYYVCPKGSIRLIFPRLQEQSVQIMKEIESKVTDLG